ncbi:MAG: DUF642 domain-containing protein, partial [Phycisphaerae bacterium]|nr:DUF642 domain-containing protein [Saprospiraceae bacterium]
MNDNCCCGNIVQVPFPGGNFEDPPTPVPGGRITFYAGDTYSTWSIDGGSIDLLDAAYNGWGAGNPNGASNFIDLNGDTPGTISANLDGLTIGCTYTIALWYAKNAGTSSANCTIKVEGGAWLNQTWTATNNGAVEWLEKCYSFVAQATSTDLQLVGSGGAANRGVLLDDITIWQCCSDTEEPVIEAPPSPLQSECGDPLPPVPTLDVSDNCPLPVMTDFTENNNPSPCSYTIIREWLATDGCGNTTAVSQIIEVEDTQAPVFNPPPSDYATICSDGFLGEFYDWIAANGYGDASDLCDSPVSWEVNYSFAPDGSCTSTPVIFIVTDICGNSDNITVYFTIEDYDAPQIITPAQNLTVNCDPNAEALFSEWLADNGGAEAEDPCSEIVWDNNAPSGVPSGLTFVTFTATDGCSNAVSTTAYFFQPATITKVFIDSTTCNPNLAGSDTVQTTQGNCLTITITTLALIPNDTLLLFDNTCDPNLAGVFTQNLINQGGCDSIVVTTLNLVLVDSTLLFSHTCDIAQAGVFTQNLVGYSGCDSVVVSTLNWVAPDTLLLFQTTCDIAQAGIFNQNLLNQFGCDSIVITTVNLLNSDTTLVTAAPTCDSATSGIFIQNLVNSNGCDSIVVTTVNLIPGFSTQVSATTCDPVLTGVFVQNLTAQNGCDSVVTTTVSLIQGIATQVSATTCDPALTGVFVQNLTAQNGCDSVVTTTV